MLIDCPNCSTEYDLDVTELSAAGFIRCAQCRTMWTPEALGAASAPQAADGRYLPPVVLDTGRSRRLSFDVIDAEVLSEDKARETSFDAWTLRGAPADGLADSDRIARTIEELEAEARFLLPALAIAPPVAMAEADEIAEPPFAEPAWAEPANAAIGEAAPAEPAAPLRLIVLDKETAATAKPRRPLWPLAVAALAAAVIALGVFRVDVVRHAPQTAGLYAALGLPVNVRGLAFADVATAQEVQDGMNVLVVTGAIANRTAKSVEVPRLRLALLDRGGAELFSWATTPSKKSLAPGETLPFRSRLASPPPAVQDVQIRFVTPRDAAPAN